MGRRRDGEGDDWTSSDEDENFEFAFNSSNFSERNPMGRRRDGEGDDWTPSGEDQNFEFAFNSTNFSDRVLRIEIAESDGGSDVSDGKRCRKRRWEHEKNDGPLHRSKPWPLFITKSIHINSAILAAKSPFFYKLFSNGMQESDQRQATLRIDYSEEAALMELLGFMYSGKLTTTSAPLLFGVLMAADKFEVPSCFKRCSEILGKLPIDSETAPLFLELPSTISKAAKLYYNTASAAVFVTKKYVNLTEHQEEVMSLPLAAIEAILLSDELQVNSEDEVYDFVLKWAFAQYPALKERKEILCSRLLRLVRFKFMTCLKLREALKFEVLGCRVASDAVSEALFFKSGAPPSQSAALASKNSEYWYDDFYIRRHLQSTSDARLAYKYWPVTIVTFSLPQLRGIVYLDLKREVCRRLSSSGSVSSQTFHLGERSFSLSACSCEESPESSSRCFGLFLRSWEEKEYSFTVSYEFSAMTNSSNKFVTKFKNKHTSKGGFEVGYSNLFGMTWHSFLSDKSRYFINCTLHPKAELTID